MGFEKIAERKIREAMEDGSFEVVSKPHAIDLEEYFKLPVELRMAYSILKSAGALPEEVELMKEVERLDRELTATRDPIARESLQRSRTNAQIQLDIALERHKRQRQA